MNIKMLSWLLPLTILDYSFLVKSSSSSSPYPDKMNKIMEESFLSLFGYKDPPQRMAEDDMCPNDVEKKTCRKGQDSYTKIDKEELQNALFKGLKIPMERKKLDPAKKLRYSSKLMFHIYKILENKRQGTREKRETNSDIVLMDDEFMKIYNSDVIITLNSLDGKSYSEGNYQVLTFSTKSIEEPEDIIGVELRLFREQFKKKLKHSTYSISVCTPVKSTSGDKVMKKVAEFILKSDKFGWISVEVPFLFKIWLEQTEPVYRIYLTAQPYGEVHEKQMHPASIGITFHKKFNQNQPFIIAFLKNNNYNDEAQLLRFVRYALTEYKYVPYLGLGDGPCKMHKFEIDFNNIGYDDWVLFPTTFLSSFCYGRCDFPIKKLNPTNHALVQSLVHSKRGGSIPKPQCAPSKTDSLPILVYDDEDGDSHIMKTYRDMIVTECGCQ